MLQDYRTFNFWNFRNFVRVKVGYGDMGVNVISVILCWWHKVGDRFKLLHGFVYHGFMLATKLLATGLLINKLVTNSFDR